MSALCQKQTYSVVVSSQVWNDKVNGIVSLTEIKLQSEGIGEINQFNHPQLHMEDTQTYKYSYT